MGFPSVERGEAGADGLGEFSEGGGDDLDCSLLDGKKPGFGGGADAVEVAFSEFLGGRVGVDQPAADHDKFGVEGDREIGDMQAHGFRLEVENLERERVAFWARVRSERAFSLAGMAALWSSCLGYFGRRWFKYCGRPEMVV